LLRRLSAKGFRIGVCWMLTSDDQRGDGRHISYLHQPEKYRHLDPQLFDALGNIVHTKKQRLVDLVERSRLIHNAQFFSETLTSVPREREKYFRKMRDRFTEQDLVFFDPDNGLDVTSVRYGARGAEKYLYKEEWKTITESGKSVLVYQHFPRVKRSVYTKKRMEQVKLEADGSEVMSIASSRVLFIAACVRTHQGRIRSVFEEMGEAWNLRSFSVARSAIRS